MLVFGLYIVSSLLACVFGCHHLTGEEVPTQPRFEVHHEPIADIWLGEMEFVNLFCGTPRTNIIPGILQGLFKRSVQDINPEDLAPEELNKYKLDHSLLYFRGQSYEYGAGMFMRSFINGTVARDPVSCGSAISWTLQGRSNCTVNQALRMAHSYHVAFGEYALLTNNCHHFVERFVQRLRDGHCESFQTAELAPGL